MLPLIIAAAGAYLIGSSKVSKFSEGGRMQDILEYETKMKGSDEVMAKDGKIEVVNNEGSGKVINRLYNQWNSIKTKAQQDKWAEKVRNTKFGTYGTISLMEILDRFNFDEAHINSVNKEGFKKEIKAALKSQYEAGGELLESGEIDIKDINYEMMDYLSRTNKDLLVTMKDGKKIKSSVGKFYDDLIFHGDFPKDIQDSNYSIQKKAFDKVEIIDDGKMAKGGEVATTILSQLGGSGRLNAMTGAYNFYDTGNGLSFKIKNARANYIKITLNSMDLYDVEIGRIRGNTYKVVTEANNVYFDQLKGIIEKATGMYLSL